MQNIDFTNFNITLQEKGKISNLPFLEIKEEILGKKYNLSLVFPAEKLAEEMHIKWKQEKGPANILSFPLEKDSGEIFISLDQAEKEAVKNKKKFDEYIKYLFIHGCLHLKGLEHSDIMDDAEDKFMKLFS